MGDEGPDSPFSMGPNDLQPTAGLWSLGARLASTDQQQRHPAGSGLGATVFHIIRNLPFSMQTLLGQVSHNDPWRVVCGVW